VQLLKALSREEIVGINCVFRLYSASMSGVSVSAPETLIDRARRFLQGNDVFISYASADSAAYALALASELTKRQLECYLDQWGTPPGPLSLSVMRQLEQSSMLVVVGSRHRECPAHPDAAWLRLLLSGMDRRRQDRRPRISI